MEGVINVKGPRFGQTYKYVKDLTTKQRVPCSFEWLGVPLSELGYEVSGKKEGKDAEIKKWTSYKSYESGKFIENTFRQVK